MKKLFLCLLLFISRTVFAEQSSAPASASDLTALKAEIDRLKGMVPDQSHVMKDVAYHFTNLWFAAEQKNWALADFYLSETRSHLRWAVRIIPVRMTPQGQEFHLAEVLDPMDKTVLTTLQSAISARDGDAFRATYQQTLNTCYACHVRAGKPFLRLQIPKQPEVQIIQLNPEP